MSFRYNQKEQSSNFKLTDYFSRERDAGVPLLPLNAVYNRVADAPEISIRTNQKLATSEMETDKDYKIKVHAGHVSARGSSIYIIHQYAIGTAVYAMYSAESTGLTFAEKFNITNNMSQNLDIFYDAVLRLTHTAGELISEKITSTNKSVEFKSSEIDLVTETDQAVEKLLIDGLSKQFPDHKFIGEESVAAGTEGILTDDPTWIIDPIDGTMNFVHSFPHSCVSIALFINKKPEIGIIYNPMLKQLFTARKGKGAFLNGNAIKVSDKTNLSEALLMMEFGTSRDPERRKVILENQQNLMPLVHGLRALGSAALNMAMVACGAADAYFEFGIHIWDIAAGELIVTEAGGVIIDPAGGDIDRLSRRVLVAGTPELAEKLSQKLVQFHPTKVTKY